MKNHSFLAGIQLNDEDLDSIVSSVYRFVDFSCYVFDTPPTISIVAKKEKNNFISSVDNSSLVDVYRDDNLHETNKPPAKEEIRKNIAKLADQLIIFDEEYYMVWLRFDYLEEDLDKLSKLWTINFHEIAAEFEGIVFIGYNSELQKIIWQQWGDGEYDEGALSNLDKIDHYADNNIKTEHKVDLKYLSLSKINN